MAAKRGRKKGQLSGLKSQINPKEPTAEIISKLEHGHTESQTVALLGLMETLGFDYNDLRKRKVFNDAKLAAGKYVLQQTVDALFRWHEAEHSRAFSTKDDKWFEGQAAAIRAIRTGELQPHLFDAAVCYACAMMVWAQRAKSQKNSISLQRLREQRQRDIARRKLFGIDGRNINPEVAEQIERERERQRKMTKAQRAERMRKRDKQLLMDKEKLEAIRQRIKESDFHPFIAAFRRFNGSMTMRSRYHLWRRKIYTVLLTLHQRGSTCG